MLIYRLDLVEELAKPIWYLDRKGELRDDQLEAFQLRVFTYFKVSEITLDKQFQNAIP